MKIFEITYLSYEGKVKRTIVEMSDDATVEDAKLKAIDEDIGVGDGIFKIIDCVEE